MPCKSIGLNGTAAAPSTPQILTVRPFPTPATHRSFLRIIVHHAVLSNLDLKSGELCQISTAPRGGGEGCTRLAFPAVVWPSADPRVQRHVALISDDMREMLGVGFEDKVFVERYIGGGVLDAGKVIIGKTVSSTDLEVLEEGWKWFLEHIFVESKYIYEGLVFPTTEYKGLKNKFQIKKIIASGNTVPETSDKPSAIRVYRMATSSIVDLPTSRPHYPSEGLGAPASSPITATTVTPTLKPTFASIGGLSSQITTLKTLLRSALHHSHHYSRAGLTPPRGILLYGPPGTGKTLLLKAIATETAANCFALTGSVVGKYLGESEASIRSVFDEARRNQPAVIFVDDVDSIAPKRGEGDGNEGRIVTTLLTEMDGMAYEDEATRLVVVAATSRPNSIDQAFRRPGRFDREVEVGIPNVDARQEILDILMRNLAFPPSACKNEVVKAFASRTHGFVGADLESLVRTGFTSALKRMEEENTPTLGPGQVGEGEVILREEDLEEALKDVRPTAMREIFLEPPKVRWTDIGGQEEVKQRLREAVEWPLTHPESFTRLGGTPRKGLLLYGPPGCSKTLTAKALATEAGLNFMAVKGPELFNMYLGESERAVRDIFRKARAASPSIIFFDEIDALSASRDDSNAGKANVLTTLLNEMDGIEVLKGVTILAATNRPELIDTALMRPGRLDTILYVGPPDLAARKQILRIKTSKMSISPDVDVDALAEKTDGYSGAEVVNICDEAIHYAMHESFDIAAVAVRHFESALAKAVPQITREVREAYENWSVGGVKRV